MMVSVCVRDCVVGFCVCCGFDCGFGFGVGDCVGVSLCLCVCCVVYVASCVVCDICLLRVVCFV